MEAIENAGFYQCIDQPIPSCSQGKELFRRGVLSEAILALEAEVRRHPGHTDAWRLLGTAHAENEDDVQVLSPEHSC